MTKNHSKSIISNGIWHHNPGLVQMLGLCPLLAVTNTVVNAASLGLATMAILIASNTLVAMLRNFIPNAVRLPIFVLVIASFVTCTSLLMQAYVNNLYQSLGIFLALITTNCIILGRIEAFAYRNSVLSSLIDGFAQGLGFLLVLLAIGTIRELIAYGTLLRDSSYMVGPLFGEHNSGLLLLALPPGAFLCLGLLAALANMCNSTGKQQ